MSATSEKARVPVLDGWFSAEGKEPHLIGSRCEACGTYYFPKLTTFCRNPDCNSEKFVEVPLSRTGKLWSYTNAAYKPPEPYIRRARQGTHGRARPTREGRESR